MACGIAAASVGTPSGVVRYSGDGIDAVVQTHLIDAIAARGGCYRMVEFNRAQAGNAPRSLSTSADG